MKKRILAFITTICALFSVVITASACEPNEPQFVDYAAQVSLDMSSDTLKQSVTVEAYIDGDTTHFNVPTSINSRGLLKARYLAVNTPESTGKIEEWGKKAANYTKTQLKNATEIIIESDDDNWNPDSTGERFLVWVWYKSSATDVYHNLNLELLQQGLAVGSKAASTRYGDQAVKAIDQASRFKLHVHSTEPDPDFYYGAAQEITLKELRLNIQDYVGARVAFIGNVSQYDNQGVYVEEYDEETQLYYGIYVYYGFFLKGEGEDVLSAGNRVRVVGVVSYWESGQNYQISDVEYDEWEPDNPENLQLISQNNPIAYTEITASQFLGKVTIPVINEDGEEIALEDKFASFSLHTSVSLKNLYVQSVYTTANDGNNDGAMTLTCVVDGKTITIRTTKLYRKGENGQLVLVTEEEYKNKTIDIVGVIDTYNGTYQVKVFSPDDIIVH